MFRWIGSAAGALITLALATLVARWAGLDGLIRDAHSSGRLLDWVTGGLCLLWLLVLLKAPWDLYFRAQAVAFEQQRSRERGVAVVPGREQYVRTVARRLGWLAVGLHLVSAILVAALARFTGGEVGYWFAAFYLVSTLLRPLVAGYAYLMEKLRAVGEESRYPRDDVLTLLARVEDLEARMQLAAAESESLRRSTQEAHDALAGDVAAQAEDARELRRRQEALGREFERTVGRLTDNQEVISGIQAFVRLISQSAAGRSN